MPSVLSLKNLRKVYGDTVAVDGISFDVGGNEIVGLLGANGAGKTTTINMVLGVLKPTSGTIHIEGLDLATHRTEALGRTNFAAVYAPVPGNLTVTQNLRVFGRLYGVAHLADRIEALLKQFDLEKFRHAKCGVLSSGEQTRVGLAKAMLNQPHLLLLDEPTASLDPSTAQQLRSQIRAFADQGAGGVLWTSHNMYEVQDVCDRVLFLSHTKILLEGNPKTLPQEHGKETLEELFIAVARDPGALIRNVTPEISYPGSTRTFTSLDPGLQSSVLGLRHCRVRAFSIKNKEGPGMTTSCRASAIVLRQFFLMRESISRVLPLFVWVGIDVVLWGFITKYLNTLASPGFSFVPTLLGAVLLWDFLIRVMQGITTAFLEDVWSRNFLNLFATPLTVGEYITGLVMTSVATSSVGLAIMLFLATTLFGFSFFSYGVLLVPFLLVLFLTGIALGVFGSAIVLRLGPAAEWFIWPIPALLSPFAGVFYPLSTLPRWMQAVAHVLPPSYVFEGMRKIVLHGNVSMVTLEIGAGLSAFYIFLTCAFFTRTYRKALNSGLIARYSAESVS